MKTYDLLAQVYETPDHLEVVTSFTRAIRPHVRARPRGSAVLDLACGTGVLAHALGRSRVRVVGVDSSREMLAIARRRCRGLRERVRFVRADLATFSLPEPCGLATACGDVMNHVHSRAALVRILRRVRANLLPGATLVFEATNRFGYEHYWDGHDYFMEGEGGDLAVCCEWDAQRRLATARMVGYAKLGRGRYQKVESTLVERFHTDAELRGALRAAGYRRILRAPWSPWSDQHSEPALDRNLWFAQTPA